MKVHRANLPSAARTSPDGWVPRVTHLAPLILLLMPGCLVPSSQGTPAQYIFFDIGTMVEAGGYVYADATEFDVVDDIFDAHRLVILDPERVFGVNAPAGQPRAEGSLPASAIWDSGKMSLWDKLDETTLIATGPPPDATAAVVTLLSLENPLKPRIGRTVVIPDSASYTAGTVVLLSDGNAFVDLYSATQGPASQGVVVDLHTGVVRSTTPRLVCGLAAYVIESRFYCRDPSQVIEVYAYSADGGIGAEVAATPIPSNVGSIYQTTPGRFQAVEVSLPGLFPIDIATDGAITTGASAALPAWESTPSTVSLVLPLDATTSVLQTSAGLAMFDGRTPPGSFALLDAGFQGESLVAIPTLGPSYFLAGTQVGGVWLFHIDSGQATSVGSFQRWW